MYHKRSNIQKLMEATSEERQITDFPGPFLEDSTPYRKLDYSSRTRSLCDDGKEVVSSTFKICKAIVVGDVAVGKTCIVNRFCNNLFESNYKATIGVDFEVEKFDILEIPFNLQIWDTAGQERFKSIAQSYYRAAKVVIIVFDLSSIYSLANCKSWHRDVKTACLSEHPFTFLVGTKKDLVSPASYEHVEHIAVKVAKQLHAEYWAVSSKTGENIDKFFNRVAALAFDDMVSQNSDKYLIKVSEGLESLHCNKPDQDDRKISCMESQCIIS